MKIGDEFFLFQQVYGLYSLYSCVYADADILYQILVH